MNVLIIYVVIKTLSIIKYSCYIWYYRSFPIFTVMLTHGEIASHAWRTICYFSTLLRQYR